MGDRDRRRRRLSREESRRALLDAGKAAVYEQPVSPGLDHIRINDVAARVGLTSGAFYHHWELQEDYRDELLDELFAAEQWPLVHGVIDSLDAHFRRDGAPVELVREVANLSWDGMADDPRRLRVQMGLWARNETQVADRLATQYEQLTKYWSDFLTSVMSAYGWRPRAPFTTEVIAGALMGLLEGLFVRSSVAPAATESIVADGERWTWFALSAVAFLAATTAPEGDDRDVLSEIGRRWPATPVATRRPTDLADG